MADMQELIARLEAAEAGSRELDIAIMTLIGGARDIGDGIFYGPNEAVWHTSEAAENEGGYWMLPAPSTSLDAALALAERVLEPVQGLGLLHAVIDLVGGNGLPRHRIAPLFCAAILKAKAQGEGG